MAGNAQPVKKTEIEERVRVTKVEGKGDVFVGQKAKYEVTGYNKEASQCERNNVRWKLTVDGESDLVLGQRGETIELEIKQEWEGKKLMLMPYLLSPKEDVSVKIDVITWELPKILIETKRIEGKMADKISRADDMHFGVKSGSEHVHTNISILNQIGNTHVRKEIENDLKESDTTLFKRFEELVKYTSTGALQRENLALVAKMKSLKSTDINADKLNEPEEYSNEVITNAVFKHRATNDFINKVKEHIQTNVIKKHNGNINKVEEPVDNIEKPKYSGIIDQITGLKIAINDTWGHRVTLTVYEYDANSHQYRGKLHIRIFDHFGLDVEDIKKYGTAELVREKLPGIVEVAKSIPSLKFIALETVIRYLTSIAAAGFRAWFILQHYRGYRPFITIMEKEIEL